MDIGKFVSVLDKKLLNLPTGGMVFIDVICLSYPPMTDHRIIKQLASAVRNKRLSKNMTQEQLASKSHIDVKTISSIENGYRDAHISSVGKLADALECSPKDLFTE